MQELILKDFQMTKWKVTSEQGKRLIAKAIELKGHPEIKDHNQGKYQLIFFPEENNYFADCYYNSNASQEEIDKIFNDYPRHEERKFEDYFETIVSIPRTPGCNNLVETISEDEFGFKDRDKVYCNAEDKCDECKNKEGKNPFMGPEEYPQNKKIGCGKNITAMGCPNFVCGEDNLLCNECYKNSQQNKSFFPKKSDNLQNPVDNNFNPLDGYISNKIAENTSSDEELILKFVSENCEAICENQKIKEIKIKNPIGTFMWAVEQMKQGKKVTRKEWDRYYCFIRDKCITLNDNSSLHSRLEHIEATDWEIYEENNFGDYKVKKGGIIADTHNGHMILKCDFENLEKAIKIARELQ